MTNEYLISPPISPVPYSPVPSHRSITIMALLFFACDIAIVIFGYTYMNVLYISEAHWWSDEYDDKQLTSWPSRWTFAFLNKWN